jgi:hypothetical protein
MNSSASLSIKSQTLKTTATQTATANKKTEQPDDKTQPDKLVLQQTTPAPSDDHPKTPSNKQTKLQPAEYNYCNRWEK